MIISVLAYIVIFLLVFNFLGIPLLFGKDKGEYNYTDFVIAGLELLIIVPLALRALNII